MVIGHGSGRRFALELVVGTILVTGGAGFIGSNLVRYLLADTLNSLVIVDKLTYAANIGALERWLSDRRVTFVCGDISDHALIQQIVQTHRPWAVMNLAAETHVDRSIDSPRAFIDTNVCGTWVLLDVSRQYVASLSAEERERFRFLQISTDEVYGALGAKGHFSEATPYAPNSPYAASKAGADHLVRAYAHTYGLATLITNCSNNYGPYQHAEKLIPLTILNALDARPLPIYGDGRQVRDWLHVEDHCEALATVLHRGRPGEQYTVGGDNEQTNLAIVDRICEALEQLRPAATNPAMVAAGMARYTDLKRHVADRPGHDRRYAIDATKIQSELCWRPRRVFEDGIHETVSWYISHREWYQASRIGYDRERLGLGATAAVDAPRPGAGG